MNDRNNSTISPVAAGIAGAVVGAIAVFAVTKILSDEKTREHIAKGLRDLRDQAQDSFQRLNRAAEQQVERIENNGEKKAKKV